MSDNAQIDEHSSAVSEPINGWENERDTERAKVNVRWFAIIILLAVLEWIRRHDDSVAKEISNTVAYGIAAAAFGMTIIESLYLWSSKTLVIYPGVKYITVFGDMSFITLLIHYTGFTQSPFFYVYFIFLISNCLRYGLLMSLYVAGLFNILYVIVLGTAPEAYVKPSVLGGEGIKIIAFWAVAFYGGTVSARIRRQASQIHVYEETIYDLRSRLSDLLVNNSNEEINS